MSDPAMRELLENLYERRTHTEVSRSWPDTERETIRCSCGAEFSASHDASASVNYMTHADKARIDDLLPVLLAGQAMARVLADRTRINPSRVVEARERWYAALEKARKGAT